MSRHFFKPALLAVCAALVAVFTVASQDQPKGLQPYKVVRVVDGDTIIVSLDGKDTRVRLIGVDTPETVHPSKPVEYYGKEASRFVTNLLKGESVHLEYDQQKTDKYGRTLAYVYRAPDKLFVNHEIIRQGYGHAYTKFPFKDDLMGKFREAEKSAREAGRGLWGESAPVAGKDTPDAKVAPKEITVYITNTGKKYHRDGCRYLSKSSIPIGLDTARKVFSPCSVCGPPP